LPTIPPIQTITEHHNLFLAKCQGLAKKKDLSARISEEVRRGAVEL